MILNWNGERFLRKFLPILLEKTPPDLADIVVADNGSEDGSLAYLSSQAARVRVIAFESNLGFTKGYNEALRQIDATYYVLLNSDVEVRDHWLEPLIALLESDPAVAACQPKLLSYESHAHFEYSGAVGGFLDRLGYPFCRGRLFHSVERDLGQYDDPCEVFWASGACMAIRARLFHRVGGFDPGFFAHMEEIDICWRLRGEGYKIMACPRSTILHVGGGTLPRTNPRKTYLNFRNNLRLLFKNLEPRRLFAVLAARIVLDAVAALRFLGEGTGRDSLAVLRAWLGFGISIPKLWLRSRTTRRRPWQRLVGFYEGSIVWEFFIRGKTSFEELDPARFSREVPSATPRLAAASAPIVPIPASPSARAV